jgi:hypothetical protein
MEVEFEVMRDQKQMRTCPRPDSITFSVPQDAIIPNRDITAPAPRESERSSSELRCDEQDAEPYARELRRFREG